MNSVDSVLAKVDANLDESVARLFDFLKIPSISTDPAHKGDCRTAADWIAQTLQDIGLDASVRQTDGHPMVVAHDREGGEKSGPHVLFYGHYDVQPVDPLDLWERAPFEPFLQDGPDGRTLIVARGASDDKGQLMTFVEACRAYKEETGSLPIRVTILLEGEEESGSPSLEPFLEANKEELSHDLAMVCDTGMWDLKTPGITTMLRGMLCEELTVTGPDRDLHSGMYGGAARNPIHVLAKVIADLRDDEGRIQVPHFYEGVIDMPDSVTEEWAKLGATDARMLSGIDLEVPAGEKGFSALEQTWIRPTCEVNGISGGYAGDGFKTVIASVASAKVSFRLVGHQDPDAIQKNFRSFVEERIPEDCSVAFHCHGSAPAIFVPADSAAIRKGREALAEEWGKSAALLGCGGSIPIVGEFKRILGMDSLLVGFALDDDNVHSPNEKYDLTCYHKGTRSWVRILSKLSE